ncbi:MAG: UDP-2,3-diacylglucosamine pyrophosphatase [Micavibrio sp.]|nr:UDP-2,3-diacylglucosamine pyrophosphatase [Micavibrio sp.]
MSARTKASGVDSAIVNQEIKKLGIFAGGGVLPRLLITHCQKSGITPYVVGFEGQTDIETFEGVEHIQTRIAASGSILKWMREQDIHDAVFIGAIKRPLLRSMIPDWSTLWFFLTKGVWARGDNAILKAGREALEIRGFKLHGIHKFLPELLTPEGTMTKKSANQFQGDIELGIKASQDIGYKDIGQAVLVKEGQVIGREDNKGTNALIRKLGEEGAILVKTCKPQQDKDLDLPTIGLETVRVCLEKKMAGIAVHAGNSLFLDQSDAVNLADQKSAFIVGVRV